MVALTDYVKKSTGFSDATIAELILSVLEFIISSAKNGEDVKFEGLGTFKITDKPEREGRNPRTGETITFKASRRLKLAFSRSFIDSIQPNSADLMGTETEDARDPYKTPELKIDEIKAEIPEELLPGHFLNSLTSTPPPIPPELLMEASGMTSALTMWHIKAPDDSMVEVATSDLTNWGVKSITPIYSPRTGWQLAGKIPELAGIIV